MSISILRRAVMGLIAAWAFNAQASLISTGVEEGTNAAALLVSTGADGAFAPSADIQLSLNPDSRFNFTSIFIPEGVTLSFAGDGQDVYLLGLDVFNIYGTIDATGRNLYLLTGREMYFFSPGEIRANSIFLIAQSIEIGNHVQVPDWELQPIDGSIVISVPSISLVPEPPILTLTLLAFLAMGLGRVRRG